MRRAFRLLRLAVVLGLLPAWSVAQESPFVIIIHPSNPTESLSRRDISRKFLREISDWKASGESVVPVDLVPESPIRAAFSRTIHGKEVKAILAYWRHRIFSGRATPPAELRTEEEVIEFVARNTGAIGYVSADISLKDVKALTIDR